MTLFAVCSICFSAVISSAQSTDQNFPTAVTANEIDGTIKARDVGDSRLTSYFYTFDGEQGDVFINVATKNFTGDIDVFTLDGLRPLAKMVVYTESGGNETGRVVYMRKAEPLILRIEGRSPNDDPATFKIKFAGSFAALASERSQSAPAIKSPEVDKESGIRVNSVGTIVEVLPKPTPDTSSVARQNSPAAITKNRKPEPTKKTPPSPPAVDTTSDRSAAATKLPVKTTPENETAEAKKKEPLPVGRSKKTTASEVKTVFNKPSQPAKKTAKTAKAEKAPPKSTAIGTAKPDPMASIRLVVQLKDGNVIERSMGEIDKFSVDKGVLTVLAKDGTIVKYSMLVVAKVTIE